jgi:hypothetical protein
MVRTIWGTQLFQFLNPNDKEEDNKYTFEIRHEKHRKHFRTAPGTVIDLTPTLNVWKEIPPPPPSRLYLLIRASIGRVLRMSGRGEKYNSVWEDFYDPDNKCLSPDGSSPHLLQLAIIMASYRQAAISCHPFLQDCHRNDDEAVVEFEDDVVGESNTPPPSPSWD